MSISFEEKISSLIAREEKNKSQKNEKSEPLFLCPHRRKHLIREKGGVKTELNCKDSKIIYKFGRKIKVTPITVYDCRDCPVPDATSRINCRHLGFEKFVHLGRVLTLFVCEERGDFERSPFEICSQCKKSHYIA